MKTIPLKSVPEAEQAIPISAHGTDSVMKVFFAVLHPKSAAEKPRKLILLPRRLPNLNVKTKSSQKN
jgi:hypothetical protein